MFHFLVSPTTNFLGPVLYKGTDMLKSADRTLTSLGCVPEQTNLFPSRCFVISNSLLEVLEAGGLAGSACQTLLVIRLEGQLPLIGGLVLQVSIG